MKNYFKTQEYVSKDVYKARGEKSMQLIDNRIPVFLNNLREALGVPITVNDWLWGGRCEWRGLRNSNSSDYTPFSQHNFGRALDFKVSGMTSDDVRKWIIDNRELDWVKPITFLESEISWVHIDCRATPNNQLWVWGLHSNKTTVYNRVN